LLDRLIELNRITTITFTHYVLWLVRTCNGFWSNDNFWCMLDRPTQIFGTVSILSADLWNSQHTVCRSLEQSAYCLQIFGTVSILSADLWNSQHTVCRSLEQSAYCLQIFFYCLCSYNDSLLHVAEYFKSLWKNSEKLYSQKHLANASCVIFLASWDTAFVAEKLIRSGQMALCWENAFQNVPR